MFINYPESLGFIGGGPFEIYLDKPDMDFCRKPKNKKKKYTASSLNVISTLATFKIGQLSILKILFQLFKKL